MKIPGLRSDYEVVNGLVYFGRMLDKIRLKASGRLPSDYLTGTTNPTHFDTRCTRFLRVDYTKLAERVRQNGSDEDVLEWVFQTAHRPNEDEIYVWNEFMKKLGWRDAESDELADVKHERGFVDRDDIQTWFDLHIAEES